MTRNQNAALAALTAAFGSSEFMFNFSAEYAHDGGASVVIGRKVFQALADSGKVKYVGAGRYAVA